MRHEGPVHAHEGTSVLNYVRVLKRHRWIILLSVVLVPLSAVLWSTRQVPVYEASAEVLLSNQDISGGITGVDSATVFRTPDRIAQTAAELAMTPRVAQETLEEAGITSMSTGQLLESVAVLPRENADILDVYVQHTDPELARELTATYAEQFTLYKDQLDKGAVRRALDAVETRLAELEANGEVDTALYDALSERQQQLQTLEALQTQTAFVIQEPSSAYQIEPKSFRNGVLGLMLGIVLGLGFAFLREALDTRIRTAEEVAERLRMPLLARLPSPPRRLAKNDRLVMVEDPTSSDAEPFRMLRANFEFSNLDWDARLIMVTSAVTAEGKSTTAANLAVALARAGRRVALVDLDLRKPFINRLFGLDGRVGLTQVALGRLELNEAIVPVALSDTKQPTRTDDYGTNGHAKLEGVLDVLPSGPIPPDAGEFVAKQAVASILSDLRDQHDVVIVDAPPLLQVGDAMALTSRVDALIVVARLKVLRRPMLRDVHRLLEAAPAKALGVVVTGAEETAGYGYVYGYSEAPASPRGRAREPIA